MKRRTGTLLLAALLVQAFWAQAAHAEDTNLQRETFAVLEDLEKAILKSVVGNAAISGAIGNGNCKPSFYFGFSGIGLQFKKSDTCPLDGKVTVSLFPLGVNVDVDVFNMKNVEGINLKAKISVKAEKGNGLKVGFTFLNGKISLRKDATSPLKDMTLNGNVVFTVGKDVLSVVGRKNIFNSSGMGFALIKDLQFKAPKSMRIEGCMLAGGVADNVDAGLLTACIPIISK